MSRKKNKLKENVALTLSVVFMHARGKTLAMLGLTALTIGAVFNDAAGLAAASSAGATATTGLILKTLYQVKRRGFF